MALKYCTLTGADDSINPADLSKLSEKYPFVEWGILFSERRAGDGERYPAISWIENLIDSAISINPLHNYSLHICGRAVQDFIDGKGLVTEIAENFARVQINFNSNNFPIADIVSMVERYDAKKTIITQHNAKNIDLWRSLNHLSNYAALFDSSGGRGLSNNMDSTPRQNFMWVLRWFRARKLYRTAHGHTACGWRFRLLG